MSEVQRAEITLKPVVYRMEGTRAVNVRSDIVYQTSGGDLTLDVYYPSDFHSGDRRPAVILVVGYSDVGAQAKVGCKFKEMESLISWSRLIAACGLIAITYNNREPVEDFAAVLRYVRENAEALGVNATRLGLWASSGNSPLALSALMRNSAKPIQCAVFFYPFLLDLDSSALVANASKTFKFVNPCAGKSVDDLSSAVPLFLARAGRDEFAGLNGAIDRFVCEALERNLPLTVVNHPTGPHAFDLLQDSAFSRSVVQQALKFLQSHLDS
jgi:dienelactone hydrolase